ncbi:MAG: DeoR/GlpR transcriptional regulator [Clostridiales bacterium]|nr:DeoR/GlpR transcriptional regulator [Clostridiales bacterium]
MHMHRRNSINQLILDKGEVRLKDLEEVFPEVSSMTLRRDLIYLENKGKIIRTRGGARTISRPANSIEDVYSQRATINTEAKIRIAKKAINYIESGRSVYIDSGTTTMCLAKILTNMDLSILTCGPNIGLEIGKNTMSSVTLLGGQLNRNNLCTSGIYAIEFLKKINIDIAFLAASSFSLDNGFTIGNFNESELKKAVIKKARHKILLMDTSKLDKTLPYTFAHLEDIDTLIFEKEPPESIVKAAQSASVTLVY